MESNIITEDKIKEVLDTKITIASDYIGKSVWINKTLHFNPLYSKFTIEVDGEIITELPLDVGIENVVARFNKIVPSDNDKGWCCGKCG